MPQVNNLVNNIVLGFVLIAATGRCRPRTGNTVRMPRSRPAPVPAPSTPQDPRHDQKIHREGLLASATLEFASHGFKGASLERIAQSVGITRAMIYYYFGGREGLYIATLEAAYGHIHQCEMELALDDLTPLEAMERLVEFRIDFYAQHPGFVALVAIENQHEGAFLRQSSVGCDRGLTNTARTRSVLERGQRAGIFRADVDPLDLHQVMVSLGIFNVSNRHTFSLIFGRDLGSEQQLAHTRKLATDVVLRYLEVR